VFRFQSKAVRDGLTLTFASFTVILLLLLAGFWQARRARVAPAAAGAGAGHGAA